jgi:hypothetical protein
VRIFGRAFPNIDEYAVLTLLKRGLFLGAEVRQGADWIPAAEHPAFATIAERLRNEAFRILKREPAFGQPSENETVEVVGPDDVTQPT